MKLKYLYGLIGSAMLLASCSTELPTDGTDELSDGQTLTIGSVSQEGFRTANATRSTYEGYATRFEEGDRLGVILIDNEGKRTGHAPFTFRNGNWSNEDAPLYCTSAVSKVIAYFPFQDNLGDAITSAEGLKNAVELHPDQSTVEAFKQADLLVWETEQPGKRLDIRFSHAFSMIDLSAKAQTTVADETFDYNLDMNDVALSVGNTTYLPCRMNGTLVCLIKDGSVLQSNDFRYFYTIGGETSVKTVKENTTTQGGVRYTFPCQMQGNNGTAPVTTGDFYCVSQASGNTVIIPGSASSLPDGLVCKGIVFHTMDNDEIQAFKSLNAISDDMLTGYGEQNGHGMVVSLKRGRSFTSTSGDLYNELEPMLQSVEGYNSLEKPNGYLMTQTLVQAIANNTTGKELTFTALDNHSADILQNATSWYAPSFMELTYLARGNDPKAGSTNGLEQVNSQLSKVVGAEQITGNLPSVTLNDEPSGGLCIMQNGSEMGWHGIPDEIFYVICAF